MSRHVSRLDKAVRVVGFSLYLSLVISIISLFFQDVKFAISLFLVSAAYFILLFAILAKTRNIHFNILMSRKSLKKSGIIYRTEFHLAKLPHLKALFAFITAFLLFTAVFYASRSNFTLFAVSLILAIFTFLYFYLHKIKVYAIAEGLVFDYGEFVVLLQWNELKKYEIKGNHIIVYLKEKNIKRGFYTDSPGKLGKILKKFIK